MYACVEYALTSARTHARIFSAGIARALQLSFWDWPTTAEEYAVLAMRLQREQSLQMSFVPPEVSVSWVAAKRRGSTVRAALHALL